MLYYTIGMIVAFFVIIYFVSYFIKKAMIERAKILFSISHLGDRSIEEDKLRKMGLKPANMRKKYGHDATLGTVSTELLNKTRRDILKIKNIFNWKKDFIFGNAFIYKKYCVMIGTIEVNKIEEQIYALQEKQAKIQISQVMQGYGLHDNERNKILAGLIEPDGIEDKVYSRKSRRDFWEECHEPNKEADCVCGAGAKPEPTLPAPKMGDKTLDNINILTEGAFEDIQSVGKQMREELLEQDDIDVNEELKEKGITVED